MMMFDVGAMRFTSSTILPTAINAGDAMLAIAFERWLSQKALNTRCFLPRQTHRADGPKGLEGQQLDIDFEEHGTCQKSSTSK